MREAGTTPKRKHLDPDRPDPMVRTAQDAQGDQHRGYRTPRETTARPAPRGGAGTLEAAAPQSPPRQPPTSAEPASEATAQAAAQPTAGRTSCWRSVPSTPLRGSHLVPAKEERNTFTHRLACFKPSPRSCCERHGMSWISGWGGDRGQPVDSSAEGRA